MFSYDFRKKAREALKGKWGLAVITGIVTALLGGTSSPGINLNINLPQEGSLSYSYSIAHILGFFSMYSFVTLMISIIIGGITEIGYKNFNMKLIKGENPQFENLFDYFKYIKKGVSMILVRGVFTFLWTLLFIIPGIVASYRYALIPYILADNPELPVMEALEKSKAMMKGRKLKLFGLYLTFTGWNLLSILSFGIGFIWLKPYMAAAEAAFYENLKNESNELNFSKTNRENTDFEHINWDE